MIAVWESDISDTFLIPRLNCSIEQTLFKSWGKLFHKQAPLYDFILRYEAWVNAIRACCFIENVPNQRKTNHFPAKFGREAPTKSAILYLSFFSETGLKNSREIPAKSAIFSVN